MEPNERPARGRAAQEEPLRGEAAAAKKTGAAWFWAAGICLALAAGLRFILVGYDFSAFCFCGAAAVLAAYGLLSRRGTRGARRLSRVLTGVLLLGFALFLTAEVPVWAGSHSDENTDAPWLIVCGAAVHGSVPSRSLTERLTAALAWLEAHPGAGAVLSGGQGGGENLSEAEAMAQWLIVRGVSPERLLLEEDSVSSYENLLFSLRMIEQNGGDPAGRVAVCSSEYHLCRLRLLGTLLGCQPLGVAARTEIFPLRLNYAVREAFGIWRIRLLGPG